MIQTLINKRYVGEPFNWFTQAALDIKATDQFNERNHYMQFDILLRELIPDTAEVSNAYKYVTPLLSNCIFGSFVFYSL